MTVLAVVGCSGTIGVFEDYRDRKSIYRGYWATNILTTPKEFQKSGANLKCWNMAGFGNLQIAGGRVVARVHGYDLGGFVSKNGRFGAEATLEG